MVRSYASTLTVTQGFQLGRLSLLWGKPWGWRRKETGFLLPTRIMWGAAEFIGLALQAYPERIVRHGLGLYRYLLIDAGKVHNKFFYKHKIKIFKIAREVWKRHLELNKL